MGRLRSDQSFTTYMIPATIIAEMITMSPMTIPKTVQVQSNSLLVLSVTEGVVASDILNKEKIQCICGNLKVVL